VVPLSSINEGCAVRVEALPDHPQLRSRLLAMGVKPGVHLEVLRRGRPGGILHLACGALEFMLRREHAAELAVSPAGA
jgi:ferrous iron transport protein A